MTKDPKSPAAPEPSKPQNVALPPIDATPEKIAQALFRRLPRKLTTEESRNS